MVRVARDSNIAVLLRTDDMHEAPNELLTAVQHADVILGWFEHLTTEEQPPGWMWPFPDELDAWFDEVKLAREQKWKGDSDDGWDSPGALQNEWSPDDM